MSLLRKRKAPAKPFRIVSDWEERLSGFLQDAINQPHREPEICEELIEYVQFLVNQGREPYRKKVLELIKTVS